MRRVVLFALAAFGCGEGAPPAPATYVGRATCTPCHEAVSQAWTGSHHDLAIDVASATSVVGAFREQAPTEPGLTPIAYRRGEEFRVLMPDGGDHRISHTFGVTPLQQYLVEFPGGRRQRLPWSWDSRPAGEGGQRWFDVQGDAPVPVGDLLHWTRIGGNWNTACADCHSTALRKGYDESSDSYATTWAELDVSCEACHGPASRHLAWAARGRDDDPAKGLVARLGRTGTWQRRDGVAIASLVGADSGSRQVETCARCHAYRSPIAETDAGARFEDGYLPTLLEEDLYFPDGQAREEVFVWGTFMQSRMSRAGVTCSDCHEPHSGTLRLPGDALCAQCHAPERYAAASHSRHDGDTAPSCINCHMPERTFMRVDGRRDHGFRVPRPDVGALTGSPDVCTTCHTDRSQEWATNQLTAWYGPRGDPSAHWGVVLQRVRRGDRSAGPALVALAGDTSLAPIVRATMVTELPRIGGDPAVTAAGRAAGDPDPLVRMAAAIAFGSDGFGSPRQSVTLLDDSLRAVRMLAARTLVGREAALDQFARERYEAGKAEWVAAQRLNADLPHAQANLGGLALAERRPAEAVEAFRRAIRAEPLQPVGHLGLADALLALGDGTGSRAALQAALESLPGVAALHSALGVQLARAGETPPAVEHLRRAVVLEPRRPEYVLQLAVVLNAAGQRDAALAALKAGERVNPDALDLMLTQATILRDADRLDEAREVADRLVARDPGQPLYRRLRAQLEARR